jgi:mannose-6-phosphate isomerase-like protein (cupin superfamily)
MPVISTPSAPTHDLGATRFTSLATPSTGTTDNSIWRVEIDPGTPSTPHALTREELFVVLDGVATVTLGDTTSAAGVGDVIVVPSGVAFGLANEGAEQLRLLCCMPVGGQARLADGVEFTPPWAQ